MSTQHDVVVIGAGFAGLGAAIRLAQHGVDDVVILERGERVGGTWRDNQYPGAACDIPSLLYSYSFAPKPDWPHAWSGSEDILGYIDDMVVRFGLEPKLRFNSEVTGLQFDEAGGRWLIDVADGSRYSARTKVQRLPIEPISQASANQRSGRCGRVEAGIAIRLYSEEDFEGRPEFTEPEILRTNLASVILQMTSLGLGDLARFPFVEPPDSRSGRSNSTARSR